MKRFLIASFVALVFLGASTQKASAWNKGGFGFNVGIGLSFNVDWSHWCQSGCYYPPAPCYSAPVYPMGHAMPSYDLGGAGHVPSVSAPVSNVPVHQAGYHFPQNHGQAPSYWYGY